MVNIIKQVMLENRASPLAVLPGAAKWKDKVAVKSRQSPNPRGIPWGRWVRVPNFTPRIPSCFGASETLILCQRIIISRAACYQAVKISPLIYSFEPFGFSISLSLLRSAEWWRSLDGSFQSQHHFSLLAEGDTERKQGGEGEPPPPRSGPFPAYRAHSQHGQTLLQLQAWTMTSVRLRQSSKQEILAEGYLSITSWPSS